MVALPQDAEGAKGTSPKQIVVGSVSVSSLLLSNSCLPPCLPSCPVRVDEHIMADPLRRAPLVYVIRFFV